MFKKEDFGSPRNNQDVDTVAPGDGEARKEKTKIPIKEDAPAGGQSDVQKEKEGFLLGASEEMYKVNFFFYL